MSTAADDQYEQQNDTTTGDVPSGVKTDDDYASRTGQYQIPVQKDETPVTDPIDPATADSDEMLGIASLPFPFPFSSLPLLFSFPTLLFLLFPFSLPSFTPLGCRGFGGVDVVGLAQDDKDAIDQSNIVGGGRTKGAKVAGGYKEPGDEEGMPPADDGTSRGASSS